MSEKQRSMNGGEAWISRQARTTNYSVSISQLRFVRYPRTVDAYIDRGTFNSEIVLLQ